MRNWTDITPTSECLNIKTYRCFKCTAPLSIVALFSSLILQLSKIKLVIIFGYFIKASAIAL